MNRTRTVRFVDTAEYRAPRMAAPTTSMDELSAYPRMAPVTTGAAIAASKAVTPMTMRISVRVKPAVSRVPTRRAGCNRAAIARIGSSAKLTMSYGLMCLLARSLVFQFGTAEITSLVGRSTAERYVCKPIALSRAVLSVSVRAVGPCSFWAQPEASAGWRRRDGRSVAVRNPEPIIRRGRSSLQPLCRRGAPQSCRCRLGIDRRLQTGNRWRPGRYRKPPGSPRG